MKRIWNPIYKRFECKNCLEEWGFKEMHNCKEHRLSIVDIYWAGLLVSDKNKYRKIFNTLSEEEYSKYDSVSDYAFYNRDIK